jgi:hypothetical protein
MMMMSVLMIPVVIKLDANIKQLIVMMVALVLLIPAYHPLDANT